MLSEEEAIKILKEMRDDLREDVNCAEDWANTGADEEKIDAINVVLNFVEKLKNAVVKRDVELIDLQETAEKEFLTKQEVTESYIPKCKIREKREQEEKLLIASETDGAFTFREGKINAYEELLEEEE